MTERLQQSQYCYVRQTSDQMTCVCGNVWDMNDPDPPPCKKLRECRTGED